jgi:hypothetical protein
MHTEEGARSSGDLASLGRIRRVLESWAKASRGGPTATIALILVCLATVVYLVTSFAFPALRIPIDSPPDWTSWFDVIVALPALTIICLAAWRATKTIATLAVGGIIVAVPCFHAFASYYEFYYLTSIETYYAVFVVFFLLTGTITLGVRYLNYSASTTRDGSEWRAQLLALGAIVAIILTATEIYLRVYSKPLGLTNWVSDIGITSVAGGRDLIHGIDPYTHALPPWGGVGSLSYGPVTFAAMAPFAYLPSGWGAIAAAAVYIALACLGIRACVSLLSPRFGNLAALLFLALPTTSWAVEAGLDPYAIGAATIVWTLYYFLKARTCAVAIGLLVGFLTMIVPAILLLPMSLFSDEQKRLRLIVGFVAPLAGLAGLAATVLGPHLVLSRAYGLLEGFGATYGVYSYLGRTDGPIVVSGAVFVLVYWCVLPRFTPILPRPDIVCLSAEVLLLIPLVIGSDFPAMFVLASGPVVVTIFSRTSASSSGVSSRLNTPIDALRQSLRGMPRPGSEPSISRTANPRAEIGKSEADVTDGGHPVHATARRD